MSRSVDAGARIKELAARVVELRGAYYRGEPLVADADYDALQDEQRRLVEEHPELAPNPNLRAGRRAGGAPRAAFASVAPSGPSFRGGAPPGAGPVPALGAPAGCEAQPGAGPRGYGPTIGGRPRRPLASPAPGLACEPPAQTLGLADLDVARPVAAVQRSSGWQPR
jgi:NAD-dependent DNA ligase adenylation domain